MKKKIKVTGKLGNFKFSRGNSNFWEKSGNFKKFSYFWKSDDNYSSLIVQCV